MEQLCLDQEDKERQETTCSVPSRSNGGAGSTLSVNTKSLLWNLLWLGSSQPPGEATNRVETEPRTSGS